MYKSLLLPDLRVMLEENDERGMCEFCNGLYPPVAAEVLEGLPPSEAWRVLSNCGSEQQAEIFGFLSLSFQVELVDSIDGEPLSKLIESMAPDDRVDLLERMNPDRVERLLRLVAKAERSDIRKLLSYPDGSAGSLMTTEYASLPADITVREAVDRLRKQAPDSETIYYVYVLDEGRRLRGFVSLRDLILARPDAVVSTIMQQDVISVRVEDDQEHVVREMARYDFIAIPVVDNQNQLVGIITHDDILDVAEEEATEDAQRQGAVEPFEDSYLTAPLTTLAWKRGIWLVILLGAAVITAKTVDAFGGDMAELAWMAAFLPMVLASGGNAGSQSATLVIRTLALGQMSSHDSLRIARREVLLALMLGGCLMVLAFGSSLWIESIRDRAVIVSLTVLLVVLLGTVTGAMLPIGFKRLGMDPALMSNPLIAALVDLLGVILYYSVARWLLEL